MANIRCSFGICQGTGGVSLFALQFAKIAGARVIATTSSDLKAEKRLQLGADSVINYRQVPHWDKEVRKQNNNDGVDITLDIAGAETIAQSLSAIRENGFVGTVGFISGSEIKFDIHQQMFDMGVKRLQGIAVGSAQSFQEMNKAIDVNHLKPVVDKTFQFSQVFDAFSYLEQGNHFGKIVITL